jgi:hypothetical protein
MLSWVVELSRWRGFLYVFAMFLPCPGPASVIRGTGCLRLSLNLKVSCSHDPFPNGVLKWLKLKRRVTL